MKTKIRKNILVAALFGLAALCTITLLPTPAIAQGAATESSRARIEGLWDSNVTIQDCASGTVLGTFRGLGLFIRGGALEQTNNKPPTIGKAALGHWRHLGGSHYTAFFQFYTFDTAGTWTGTQKVARDIQLDPEGMSFTGIISSTLLDVNDNVILTGCGTETAVRVID